MEKFILVCSVEREIYVSDGFNTFKEAQEQMMKEFKETLGYPISHKFSKDEIEELESNIAGFDKDSAYCESANHDNCDWKIFKMEF